MITHGNEIKLFSGNSNRPLAEAIADKLNTELGGIEVSSFSDGRDQYSHRGDGSQAGICLLFSPPARPSTITSWSF